MKKFTLFLLVTATTFELFAMRRLSLISADGVRLEVDPIAWKTLSHLIVGEAEDVLLPLPIATLRNIDRWLMAGHDAFLQNMLTIDFVRDVCALLPKEDSHAFHILAQQIARSQRELYVLLSSVGSVSDISGKLNEFLMTCPQLLRAYVNIYFYLLINGRSDVCLCEQFKQMAGVVNSENMLIDAIYDLPATKDAALRQAVMQKKEHYCLYLLALGADPDQKIAIKKTCLCARCSLASRVDVEQYTMVPLVRFARSMHSVEAAMLKSSLNK